MAGKIALPTPQQQNWQDFHMGMLISLAPNTWQEKENDDLSTPLSAINPALLDTEQWADTAAKLGAKYIILVAKHTGGFCLWQTGTTDYSIKSTPWREGKGDVVADLAVSCKKHGLGLGIYLSAEDRKLGAGLYGMCKTPEEQKFYNDIFVGQVAELLNKYGPLVELGFGGNVIVPVRLVIEGYAPQTLVNQGAFGTLRWAGTQDGTVPYPAWNAVDGRDAATGFATAIHGDPDGDKWLPNAVTIPLRAPSWFWSSTNGSQLLSLDELLRIFYGSVGRGAQLVIGMSPDRTGLIPAGDVARVQEFGEEVRRRFGKAVAETRGSGYRIELKLSKPSSLDHAMLMEDLSQGERVREYELEGLQRGKWVALTRGTAIGQMRLQPFPPTVLEAVRIRVVQSSNLPILRRFAVFATNQLPPKNWEAQPKVWADNQVGSWGQGKLELKISEAIKTPGIYLLHLVPEGGAPFVVSNLEIRVEGVPQPQILREVMGRKDLFELALPANGQTVTIQGMVRGANAGTALLRKK
ncbi:MAG: alpha-L-fucosidase [Terriglobia bacterium]